ncbi:ATP-dependent DNA ligase [Streptomyces sp. NPDC020707]|uniref:ATP-dependent DNA ligase n=1 Tax=Streptomyces sp. NPDC020707 TaxID=3365084 RepID=UPI00379F1139
MPPIEPMLARPLNTLPPAHRTGGIVYQQKVDGFRVIVFLRAGRLTLQSRQGSDLTPAFPDLTAAAARVDRDLVADGELVTFHEGRLDFSVLQQRARRRGHGAAEAARERPAHVILFDLLEEDGEMLMSRPLRERWERLEALFTSGILGSPWTLVTSTTDRSVAATWLAPAYGRVGIEGAVVKTDGPYRPGERGSWTKVRAYETAEGIVAGVTGPPAAPHTLLLARYDAARRLRLIARTTPLASADRQSVGRDVTSVSSGHPWEGVRFSAGWGQRDTLSYTTVLPRLVVEFRADTAVDHGRYRHPVRYLRARDDLTADDVPILGTSRPTP